MPLAIRGVPMFVGIADEQAGYVICKSLLTGLSRRCLRKLYCGVLDPNSEIAQELADLGAHVVSFRPGCSSIDATQPSGSTSDGNSSSSSSTSSSYSVEGNRDGRIRGGSRSNSGCSSNGSGGGVCESPCYSVLRRCSVALLVPNHTGTPDTQPMEDWTYLVELAHRARVEFVFMLSLVGIDYVTSPRLKAFVKMEHHFRDAFPRPGRPPKGASGGDAGSCGGYAARPWTPRRAQIIRKSLPLENLLLYRAGIQTTATLAIPIWQNEFSPVAIADVALGVLYLMQADFTVVSQGDHSYAGLTGGGPLPPPSTLPLAVVHFTGPELVQGRQMAEYASQVLHTDLQFTPMRDYAEVRHYLACTSRLQPDEIEFLVEVYEAINAGFMTRQSGDLAQLLGHPPMGVRKFFEYNEGSFRPPVNPTVRPESDLL
ncbi:hypothetical protein BJ085DRAFT_35334 [Dimargaris cristalligena]|uniref:NmrA-like domain-containing protein n=1 Tax=Dimargaris cristalligena TaxID=215637 RepID=A0A4P9ZUT6_9FUNG|nr:hypothetical protein BJ085DRAFT_35334 [Dimargaris cristalligena]|eukprot:RKP37344.1 hypothetical protein BJ085DRAFT_35334 [Dimargaris cristalligena]